MDINDTAQLTGLNNSIHLQTSPSRSQTRFRTSYNESTLPEVALILIVYINKNTEPWEGIKLIDQLDINI